MARGCCGAASCSCVYQAGENITIAGSGSAQDPLVISADFAITATDNSVFDITITGSGTDASPYNIEVDFASTASVSDLSDWSDTAPTNGQVPVWNAGLGEWVPGSNTPAPVGAVSHDTSLDGDGSVGDILEVVHDPLRFTDTTADGIGLSDDGVNGLVRQFPNSAARTAADPAVDTYTITHLATDPGHYDVHMGSGVYQPLEPLPVVTGGAFLELSGPYDEGRVVTLVKALSVTTDIDGNFTVLSAGDLAGYAGVLTVAVQPSGTVGYFPVVSEGVGVVTGTAYRLDNGAAFPSQPIEGLVTAILYV